MAELEDNDSPKPLGNGTEQYRDLAQVRAEAVRKIAQSGQRVVAAQPQAPARDGLAAAERLALEQELTVLRRALMEKERILDNISQECRRLEDALEDKHMAADGLRQELERKGAASPAERALAAEPGRKRDELSVQVPERGTDSTLGDSTGGGTSAPRSSLPQFLAGVGVGLVAAVAIGLGYLGLDRFRGAPQGLPHGSPPEIAKQAVTGAPTGQGEAPVSPPAGGVGTPARTAEPAVPRTLRHRFPDGTAGPPMVALPAGSFTMGSHSLSGAPDEEPAHEVSVGGFLIGANEVTFADYDRFARATGRRLPDDFGWGRGPRPVVGVSWEDAQAYAQWLSHQTGQRYRLPSEAEWEYAARGGTKSSYWWGFGPETGRALCFDCGTNWDGRSTAPVGSFGPNPVGLYDTAGNALEWTADCYRPSYTGAPADGGAWERDSCSTRVARGGAFNKPAKSMRSAARAEFAPDTRLNMLGFRLAGDE